MEVISVSRLQHHRTGSQVRVAAKCFRHGKSARGGPNGNKAPSPSRHSNAELEGQLPTWQMLHKFSRSSGTTATKLFYKRKRKRDAKAESDLQML